MYRTGATGTPTTSAPGGGSTGTTGGAVYSVTDTFIGPSFLTGFNHEAIADPTNGRVK